jgi:23S rRNA pseudouridine955/2504/2580 synthase
MPAPATVLTLTADEGSEGQRLDNFLFKALKGVPKTHVYRIIRSGEVRLNKGRAQADSRVQAGDQVRVPPIRLPARALDRGQGGSPGAATSLASATHGAAVATGTEGAAAGRVPPREFPVLFEDGHLLAIDKPAGVAVHGGSGVSFGVIEQLRQARPEAKFLELVHRLDKETSGILLVAKRRSALTHLQSQFKERETGKTYQALVQGAWPANKKVIDLPLHKFVLEDGSGAGERRVKVVAKGDPDGMRAITLVQVAQRMALPAANGSAVPATLLEVTIKTGRTHQIRVHLAASGHGILGDDKYGDFALNKTLARLTGGLGLKRMFLHAWRLRFVHPGTGEELTLTAGLPPDLAQVLAPSPPTVMQA